MMRYALALVAAGLLAVPAAAQEVVRVPAGPGDGASPAELAAFAKLDTMKISLDFEDTPMPAVLQFLRQTSGINLVVDPEVRRDGGLDERRISLQVSELPLRSALSLVLEFGNLAARWRHGVLFITTPEKARGEMVLRLYDVRDLTFKLTDFPGPSLALKSGTDGMSDPLVFGEADEKNPPPTTDEIVETVKGMMADAWEAPGATCTVIGGMLLVRQTPEAHRDVMRLLTMLRATR